MKENAVDHLKQRKWQKFLMAVPLNKPSGYYVANANDIYILRVRASQLSNAKECDRTFSITTDFDTRIVTVTSKLKYNGDRGDTGYRTSKRRVEIMRELVQREIINRSQLTLF